MDYTRSIARSVGAINAEPPERETADAALDAAAEALNRAEAHLGSLSRWSRVALQPREYRELLNQLIRDVQMVKAQPRLTNDAKWDDIDDLISTWRPKAEGHVTTVEQAAARWEQELKEASQPSAPTSDPMLLEAKLANARTDAALVLADAEEMDIPDRLAEMARSSDLALRYLLLATPWPATYLRGRGANDAAMLWHDEKRKVLASILTGEALQAFEQLAGVPHAQKAALAMRTAHNAFTTYNPELFQSA